MVLLDKQNLFCTNVATLVNYAQFQLGLMVTFGESFRTVEQQNIYLKTGFTKYSHSRHMDRLAIDLNFFKDGKPMVKKEDFAQLAAYWQMLSPYNVSGFDWGWDFGHFEMKP